MKFLNTMYQTSLKNILPGSRRKKTYQMKLTPEGYACLRISSSYPDLITSRKTFPEMMRCWLFKLFNIDQPWNNVKGVKELAM